MENLVSVIIPVYNVEQYLNRCVDSVINQTYKNLEIILVDDGSTDNSGAICDEYLKNDKRIKVIHKKNGGLSSARNAGLDVFTGDFVSFIDSDDWVELDLYEKLTSIRSKKNGSIIVPSFFRSLNEIGSEDCKIKEMSSADYFKKICTREVGTSVCGRLFDKNLFKHERFREGRLNEDFIFCSKLFMKNNFKIIITEYNGYHYFYRADSITHQKFGKSIVDAVYNTLDAVKISQQFNQELEPYCRAYNAYQARTVLVSMPKEYRKTHTEFEKLCIKCLKENLKFAKKYLFKFKDVVFSKIYMVSPFFGRLIKGVIKKK